MLNVSKALMSEGEEFPFEADVELEDTLLLGDPVALPGHGASGRPGEGDRRFCTGSRRDGIYGQRALRALPEGSLSGDENHVRRGFCARSQSG